MRSFWWTLPGIRTSENPRLSLAHLSCRLGLAMICLGLAATGCGQSAERKTAMSAMAVWEDRRQAPTDSLSTLLQSPDAHLRRAAARTAGLIGQDDILPELIKALDDRSSAVRQEAAFALGLLGNAAALPALRQAAVAGDRATRLAALEGLAHLPGSGESFLAPALNGDSQEAIRAWNGLRNRTEDVEHDVLVATIQSGLARQEDAVIWRVLRCAEKCPDSTLVPQLAPFAQSRDAQIRVHACRALGRQSDGEALAAVLESWEVPQRWSIDDEIRVRIAQLGAVGRLAAFALAMQEDSEIESVTSRLAAVLTTGARHENSHVAETALRAMSRAVADLPLPGKAAQRESLLPVWRIRMAHAAREVFSSRHAGVRAAAAAAYGELRGRGAEQELFSMLDDPAPSVQAAVVTAIGRHGYDPWHLLSGIATGRLRQLAAPGDRDAPDRPALNAVVRIAAIETAVDRALNRRHLFPLDARIADRVRDHDMIGMLVAAVSDSSFPVAATAAPLLGQFGSAAAFAALREAYLNARGEGAADIRLAVLDGMRSYFATPSDSTGRAPAPATSAQAAAILESAFDSADIRIRLKAREVAVTTALLPDELIPSAASLRATLPAHARSPKQPPVALPFDAPSVVCRTEAGEFVIELDGKRAPNTVASFLALVESGFYDGLTFHRVVPDFVVQGGDPRGDGWGGPGYSIRSEWSRVPYERGTVGIAHSGKDTGGSQFFVALSAQPHLNGRYTVFGRISDGMRIVDRIEVGSSFSLAIQTE